MNLQHTFWGSLVNLNMHRGFGFGEYSRRRSRLRFLGIVLSVWQMPDISRPCLILIRNKSLLHGYLTVPWTDYRKQQQHTRYPIVLKIYRRVTRRWPKITYPKINEITLDLHRTRVWLTVSVTRCNRVNWYHLTDTWPKTYVHGVFPGVAVIQLGLLSRHIYSPW